MAPRRYSRNYLRVRGEYHTPEYVESLLMELPPRARRILASVYHVNPTMGTTSACAENTRCRSPRSGRSGNYLRVRGEYKLSSQKAEGEKELPPRARRILGYLIDTRSHDGTTSACAENTNFRPRNNIHDWNYLRVRGEYREGHHGRYRYAELPPRARRIPSLLALSA